MKKQKFQKTVLLFLIAVVIGFLVYNLYISKSNARVVQLNGEIRSKQTQVKELRSISKKRSEVEDRINHLEKELEYIDREIPDSDSNRELTEELYELLKSKELKIDNISITYPDSGKAQFGTTRLSIQSTGSLMEIEEVINYLRNNKRRLAIKMFSIRSNPDNTYSASINVELKYIKV